MQGGQRGSKPKAILFDVDGTLVDSLEVIIAGLGEAYAKFADYRPPRNEIRALVGTPLRDQLKLFRKEPISPEMLAEAMEFAIEQFEANAHLEVFFGPAIEALRMAHADGIKTALVTSKSAREIAGFLTRFPAAHAVDATVCADDVTHPKPHSECVFLALEKLGVCAEEAVLVGDSVFDLQAARGAKVSTIAVAYGAGTLSDLLAEHPDILLRRPDELLEWVATQVNETCLERSKTNPN